MLFTNSFAGIRVGRTGKSIEFQTPHLTTNNLIFGEVRSLASFLRLRVCAHCTHEYSDSFAHWAAQDGKIRSWKVYNRGSAEEVAKIRELYILTPMKI